MTTTTEKKTTTKVKASTTKKNVDVPVKELPSNPFAFEVLQLASSQRTKEKKIEVLKKYEHPSLKAIFIWNFDESIVTSSHWRSSLCQCR